MENRDENTVAEEQVQHRSIGNQYTAPVHRRLHDITSRSEASSARLTRDAELLIHDAAKRSSPIASNRRHACSCHSAFGTREMRRPAATLADEATIIFALGVSVCLRAMKPDTS